jgi:hypothetical protein
MISGTVWQIPVMPPPKHTVLVATTTATATTTSASTTMQDTDHMHAMNFTGILCKGTLKPSSSRLKHTADASSSTQTCHTLLVRDNNHVHGRAQHHAHGQDVRSIHGGIREH